MDNRDAELIQEMQDLCECYAVYSKGIVFGVSRGLGSRRLFSQAPVDRCPEGDDRSTCRFIVIRASSKVRIDIPSKCIFWFSFVCSSECCFNCSSECFSKTQSPVLDAVEVPKYTRESYHMLIARVVIVPAENPAGIWDIGPSGGHRIHEAWHHWLVYSQIAGFFVGLSLVKVHRHWRGNWSGFVHSEHRQDRRNVAVLMDVDHVILPIACDVHAEIEGDTPKIMHLERLLHLILHLPNRALVSNDKVIINVRNLCGN